MNKWTPQQFLSQAPIGYSPDLLARATAVANQVLKVNPRLPPLFSLKHIAFQTETDYIFLRNIVARRHEDPYKIFRLRKRLSPGETRRFRIIAVPDPDLMRVQRWITQRILALAKVHPSSVAYAKECKLFDAAQPHAGAKWLIKLDVQNFFESINEVAVFRVFQSLGYGRLVSLELTRLCTRLGYPTKYRQRERWNLQRVRRAIDQYRTDRMGHLPQGAPTSPMLANLAVKGFDEAVAGIALLHGMIYTRYADDIIVSTKRKDFDRDLCAKVIGEVFEEMGKVGLSPNISKTRVVPPGGRKIVLGLIVNGKVPALPRDFKLRMRQHVHYLQKPEAGPLVHAQARGFASILGMKQHLYGLAAYATQIEPTYGQSLVAELNKVSWPI